MRYTMKKTILACTIVLALSAQGEPAKADNHPTLAPTWTSMIAYYNPNDSNPGDGGVDYGTAEMSVIYYKSTGGFESSGALPVLPHHSGVLLVGSTTNFKGAAVISSNLPIMAVYKQETTTREPFSPILYSSFNLDQTGEGLYYLPTVQRTEQFNTQIAIQNIESYQVAVSLDFYAMDGTLTSIAEDDFPGGSILPQSSRIFSASEITGLPTGFVGSLVINAHEAEGSRLPKIVAVAQDSIVGGRQTFTYEGVGTGAQNVFLPAVYCQANTNKLTTRLWVQNTSLADPSGNNDTTVTVNYYNNASDGSIYASYATTDEIAPGGSAVIDVCNENNTGSQVSGMTLSAVVKADNSQATIAVVGKTTSTNGLYTAFTGQTPSEASVGSDGIYRVVLPYVEYSLKYGYKTYLYIQNTDDSAADDVVVKYYKHAGGSPVSQTLGTIYPGSMLTADASKARAYDISSRGFFGAVVIESTHPITALARVQAAVNVSGTTLLGEDYSALTYKKP